MSESEYSTILTRLLSSLNDTHPKPRLKFKTVSGKEYVTANWSLNQGLVVIGDNPLTDTSGVQRQTLIAPSRLGSIQVLHAVSAP